MHDDGIGDDDGDDDGVGDADGDDDGVGDADGDDALFMIIVLLLSY